MFCDTGEVWLSGDPIAKGYYNMPDLTRDSFLEDPASGQRWFKTGDVGEFDEEGQLTIIDRKKDLVKLQVWTVNIFRIQLLELVKIWAMVA